MPRLVRGRMFYVFGGFVRKLGYMFDSTASTCSR